MAVKQPRAPLSPDARQLQYAVSRAKPPREDPTGERTAEVVEIARRYGVDVGEMLEWFAERAAVREYDGEMDRDTAEMAAVCDVEGIAAAKVGR